MSVSLVVELIGDASVTLSGADEAAEPSID